VCLAVRLNGQVHVEAILALKPGWICIGGSIEESDVVAVSQLEEDVHVGILLPRAGYHVQHNACRRRQSQNVFIKPTCLLRIAATESQVVDGTEPGVGFWNAHGILHGHWGAFD